MNTHIQQTPMTVNELAIIMQKGFADVHKKIDEKVDSAFNELAGMVAREFKVVHKELADVHAILNTDIPELKDSVEHLDHRMDIHEKAVVKDHNLRIRRVERKLQIA